jgi:PEP-CTERM motif-containing protein
MNPYTSRAAFLAAVLVAVAVPTQAGPTTFALLGSGSRHSAMNAETSYLSGLGSLTTVTEDFESSSFVAGTHASSFSTSVGTFTGVIAGNTGIGASCEPFCTSGLAILDRKTTPFDGRYAIEDGGGKKGKKYKWLDSNDYKEIVWTPLSGFLVTSVGFFVTDLADQGAHAFASVTDGLGNTSWSSTVSGLSNGKYYYVEISDPDGISSIKMFSSAGPCANDGFGIDRFTIAGSETVPEPVSLVLLGSGLVGLALRRRR